MIIIGFLAGMVVTIGAMALLSYKHKAGLLMLKIIAGICCVALYINGWFGVAFTLAAFTSFLIMALLQGSAQSRSE